MRALPVDPMGDELDGIEKVDGVVDHAQIVASYAKAMPEPELGRLD
jgi:hypothetical protein